MSEPQRLTVAFDEAGVDGEIDRRPGLLVVTGRADQPFARIIGGSDQLAHPPHIRCQLAYTALHEATESLRYGDGLVGQR